MNQIKYNLQTRDIFAQLRSFSDKRLKKNITPLNLKKSALNTIKDLKTYQFYWKNKKEYGKGPQIGLIAQEVKKILPQVVRKKDNLLNINYSQLSVVTLQAVKDLYSLLILKSKVLEKSFKTLLNKEINKLKFFVKNLVDEEVRVLVNLNKSLNNKVLGLRVEVKNQTQKMKDIEIKLLSQNRKTKILKASNKKLNNKVLDLNKEVRVLVVSNKNLNNKVSNLSSKIKELKRETASQTQQIRELKRVFKAKLENQNKIVSLIKTLEKRFKKLEQEKRNLAKSIF